MRCSRKEEEEEGESEEQILGMVNGLLGVIGGLHVHTALAAQVQSRGERNMLLELNRQCIIILIDDLYVPSTY